MVANSNKNSNSAPLPLFDSLEHLRSQSYNHLSSVYCLLDIQKAHTFLNAYRGSQGTFNSYRREIERFLQWGALIAKKSLSEIKRADIEAFVEFCQNPPKSWIGAQKPPKFIVKEGTRLPNPAWKPFTVSVTKSQHREGHQPQVKDFSLSSGTIKELFAILSSFYNYLLQEEYVTANPVALVRQKSKFIQKDQHQSPIRRLSELQWQYVIQTTKHLAEQDRNTYERSLFIMSCLYGMYLRISELAAHDRWAPKMTDFYRDIDNNWWFITVGKGNKKRQIAVSNAMLEALKRWRNYLQLSPLPSPADHSPLLPKNKGQGPIKSVNHLRRIVQFCFDEAGKKLNTDGFHDEASTLIEATTHWLRHTGISDDVKIRPREHVRDDAGHSSSATTDKYIDIELRARHASAKKKIIAEDK